MERFALPPCELAINGGALRIYCHHRRHLFKPIARFKAERTPPFAAAKPFFPEEKKTKRYFLITFPTKPKEPK